MGFSTASVDTNIYRAQGKIIKNKKKLIFQSCKQNRLLEYVLKTNTISVFLL